MGGSDWGGTDPPKPRCLRWSRPLQALRAAPLPAQRKAVKGFLPAGCRGAFFIVWKRKHLGLILPAPAAFPAPGRMLRGTGASAAWSGVERGCAAASAPGPAGSASLGRCPRQGLASCRSPPALPDGFAQPLLCRPGACFPPGKRGFGARRCLLTSAALSFAAGSDAIGPCLGRTHFQLHESLNFLFLQLSEV